jgi:hypothetical protein
VGTASGHLPPPPPGRPPKAIAAGETVYVAKLLDVYGEVTGRAISKVADLSAHPEWSEDLQRQRVRFYDAETIVRALQGGNVKVIDGLVQHRPGAAEGVSVSAQHSAKASLSKMLLKELGAEGARVRTDASGKTRDLSFRDLERHVLINEAKIQESSSPILSGQYVSKTAETSAFKYLLTGVDDSALDLAKPDSGQPLRQAAQLELLDRQIRDLEREITEPDQDHEELVRLGNALDEQLSLSFRVQESAESGYRELTEKRRALRREHEDIQDRLPAACATRLKSRRLMSSIAIIWTSTSSCRLRFGLVFLLYQKGRDSRILRLKTARSTISC